MHIILGTMTFGGQVNQDDAAAMIGDFASRGHSQLDTAYVYNDGATESLLGRLNAAGALEPCTLAGKANPWVSNGLTPDSVTDQLNTSLKRLNTDSIDLFYLHAPDLDTPIELTLSSVAKLHAAGRFKRFGVSNFAAWQVAEIFGVCRANGWPVPVVYQGMYNALTRDVERELFPCLSNFDMDFYVYNPLAGGLLSGKHTNINEPGEGGRFTTFNGYQDRYWKPAYFEVIQRYVEACEAHGISPAAAALRWLVHHSALAKSSDWTRRNATERAPGVVDGHGIILGASSTHHLSQNLDAIEQGPLPETIVHSLDAGWETVRPACIKYFRP